MPTPFGNQPRENLPPSPLEARLNPFELKNQISDDVAIPRLIEGRDLAQDEEALKAKLVEQFEEDRADYGIRLLERSENARRQAVSAIGQNNFELQKIGNDQVREIFTALQMEKIPTDTSEAVKTRYIFNNYKRDVNGIAEYTYGVDHAKVHADIDLLKSFVSTYPRMHTVIDALLQIAEADKRHIYYLHNKARANNYTDNAVLYMGKILSFGTFSAVAFLMGTHAFLAKGSYVPTAIYATIAALHVPQFREMFFPGKKEAQVAKEIDAVLNEPVFMELSARYGIQGMPWRNLAVSIMGDAEGSQDSLKTLADPTAPTAIKDAAINRFMGLLGSDADAQKSLQQMIADGRLVDFVSVLLKATDDSAKETVAKFIEKGMWRQAKGDVRKLVRAEESGEKLAALKVETDKLPTQLS